MEGYSLLELPCVLSTRWAGGRASLALSVEIYGATGRGLALCGLEWPSARG